jgi:predicted transcriptional regulator
MANEDAWSDENEDDLSESNNSKQQEIQKLFAEMMVKAKKAMHYLVLEGFVEPTDDPNLFKYTPEGFVMAQKEYKKLKDQGLL